MRSIIECSSEMYKQQLALCCWLRENMKQMTSWTHREAILMSNLYDTAKERSSIMQLGSV